MGIQKIPLPKYDVVLPMSKMKVEYRPFTVGEEKILLLAQQENKVDIFVKAINQLIEECTFGKHNIDSLNKIDAEYLFIMLRNKSLGEGVEVNGICKNCAKKTPLMLNLEKIKVDNIDYNKNVQLSDDIWVTMRIPTIKESMLIEDNGNDAIAVCIDSLIIGESSQNFSEYPMEDRVEWVESLPPKQIMAFSSFFEHAPVLVFDHDYKCMHCGDNNNIHVEGIESFFA